jgi:NitT/TauT family transport system substrate-binding protein
VTKLTMPRAAAVAAAVGALAVCAGNAEAKAPTHAHAAKMTNMTVGISPTISSVDVLYAIRSGLFKKAGLNVTTSLDTTSGAATFPEVLNNQLQMTVVDPVSPILAISQGLKLSIAAPGNVMPANPKKNYTGIMAKASGPINNAAALDNQTVAVNSLDSILQLLAMVTIDADGGHSSTVHFVEVPPLSEVNSVAQGQTAALINVEPLISAGKAAGLTEVAQPPSSVAGLPQDVLVTSQAYAKSNPKAVAAFSEAILKANAALAAKPSLILKTGIAAQEITAAQASGMILPTFAPGGVPGVQLTRLMKLMVKYKMLSKPVAVSKLLASK